MNRQVTDWEKYLHHISDKIFLFRIYREFLQLNNQKTKNPTKIGKKLGWIFCKR